MQTKPYQFNNTFFFMRHGESHANRNGIIVSSPERGVNDFPLTDLGVSNVADRAVQSRFDSQLKIICSDFLRTRQTAEVVAEVVDSKEIHHTTALRERCFGEYEGFSDEYYPRVWQMDQQGVAKHNVESLASVLHRMLACVWELEQQHHNQTFLLVSHGDCLQILLTWFQGMSPTKHRSIPSIKTAMVRSLKNQQSLQNIFNQLNLDMDAAA